MDFELEAVDDLRARGFAFAEALSDGSGFLGPFALFVGAISPGKLSK